MNATADFAKCVVDRHNSTRNHPVVSHAERENNHQGSVAFANVLRTAPNTNDNLPSGFEGSSNPALNIPSPIENVEQNLSPHSQLPKLESIGAGQAQNPRVSSGGRNHGKGFDQSFADQSRKLNAVQGMFKDTKFDGNIGMDIKESLRMYNVCARQCQL